MHQTAETAQCIPHVQDKHFLCSLLDFFRKVFMHLLPLHPRTRLRKNLSLPVLTRNSAEQQCSKEGILLALLQFCFLDVLCLWVSWLSLYWGYSLETERIIVVSKKLTEASVSGEELALHLSALLWQIKSDYPAF